LITTYGSAAKYIDAYHVAILDEAHHNPVKTIAFLLSQAERLTHVYSMTATDFREDGLQKAIFAFTGTAAIRKDLKFGIDNGWVEHFDVFVLKIKDRNFRVTNKWSRPSAYKRMCDESKFVSVVMTYLQNAINKDRKVIVLFKTLQPVRSLSKSMKDQKVRGASADFKKPIHDFKQGNINGIVATNKLLSEGVDVPGADVLIMATMHSSDISTLQAIGRVLRKGGKKPIIIDINLMGYDNFDKNISKRLEIYNKFADSVDVKEIIV